MVRSGCNKMSNKVDLNLQATYKYRHSTGWRAFMLRCCILMLLQAAGAMSLDATTMGLSVATAAASDVLRRGLKVGYDGNATVLCKTLNRSNTYFYDVANRRLIKPLNVDNDLLSPYAVLFLDRIRLPTTYECWYNETQPIILSETFVSIDSRTQTVRIEMGIGDDAALICNHDENQEIYFQKPPSVGDTDIIQIDSRTSLLLVRNASAQFSTIRCTYLNNKHIDESELIVGTPPLSVENFTCWGKNYQSMNCEFLIPPNNITPEYNLTYLFDYPSDLQNCELQLDSEKATLVLKTSVTKTLCPYYPIGDIYEFNLVAKNVLGTTQQSFSVSNHEHVIPPKLEINVTDITSNSVNLYWTDSQKHYYKRGVIYDIHIKPLDRNGYAAKSHCRGLQCNMTLRNLTYANWNYTLKIRARVNAPTSRWNEPRFVSFTTEPRIPDRPPKTVVGGFYIHYNSANKEITLYWEELAKYEENGPGFHYKISELDMNGDVSITKRTNEKAVVFPWSDEQRAYEVRAVNDLGESQAASRIRADKPKTLHAPQEIEQLYSNRKYILTWKHPGDYKEQPPSNYTVFWCQARPVSPKECEGTMHFQVVNSTTTEFYIDSDNLTLNMAVAANYPTWSTGLHWKTCFGALGGELEKVVPEAVAISSTIITLTWRLEETCIKALKGYQITYCEVSTVDQPHCDSESLNNTGIHKYNITNLKPFTWYNITMVLFSEEKWSPRSEIVSCRTKDAASDPPTNLLIDKAFVTSNSLNISWDAPKVTNGILQKYTIWYLDNTKNYTASLDIPIGNLTHHGDTRVSFKLAGLSSYTTYSIWLTAWTSEESKRNENEILQITTLIGRPSTPQNVFLNKEGNFYILNWTDPEMPSGRVELYELTFFIGNDETRVTYVQTGAKPTHACRLNYPGCSEEQQQKMGVRAINVVSEQEFDYVNFDRTDLLTDEYPQDFECKGEDITEKLHTKRGTRYYMLKSSPKFSESQFTCAPFPWKYLVATLLFVGMFLATVLWSYNFIHRQLGVRVKLPDPINDLMNISTKLPDHSTDSKPEQDLSEISNAFDYFSKSKEEAYLLKYGSALTPSSSESGVHGVGGADSVSRSSSREDPEEYFTQRVARDEIASSESTTTLNDTSLSSHQHAPLQQKLEHINRPTLRSDGYLVIENVAIAKSPAANVGACSSPGESSYLVLHPIPSNRDALKSVVPVKIVGAKSFGSSDNATTTTVNSVPTATQQTIVITSPPKPTVFSNYLPNNFLSSKGSTTQTNLFKNLPLTTGDYVLPDAIPKLAASHQAAAINEENETSQKSLQQPTNPIVSYGYVTSDFWSKPNSIK